MVHETPEEAGDVRLSTRKHNYVRNLVTEAEYSWERGSWLLNRNLIVRTCMRIVALFQSFGLFFLVSTSTALFFRVVMTSGMWLRFWLILE